MRVRVSGTATVEAVRSGRVLCGDFDQLWSGTSILPLSEGHYSHMSDEYGVAMERSSWCTHHKRDAKFVHRPISYVSSVCADSANIRTYDRSYDELFNAVLPIMTTDGYDWAQLNAEAYITMKPSLESGLNLAAFLAELKEVKDLFKLWKRSSSLISNIASGHLNVSFGWIPTVGDIFLIYEQLANWKEALADYKSKQGLPQKRHFKKVLEDIPSYTETGGENASRTARRTGKRKVTYHATMRFNYVVPALEKEFVEVKALLDLLGLKFNPALIWELTPFSFVVDWFLGVGNYLQSRSSDYLESKVIITDFCSSITIEETYDLYSSFLNDPKGQNWPLASVTEKYYKRRRELPNATDFGLALSHRYGTKQIVLSAALVLS